MEKFLLEDFAGGAVAERIGSAIQRVYENIANPNMDAEKARKLTIELTFKPDKNDRTDVDVTAIVKTSLQPEKAISSRMIVESDLRGTEGHCERGGWQEGLHGACHGGGAEVSIWRISRCGELQHCFAEQIS